MEKQLLMQDGRSYKDVGPIGEAGVTSNGFPVVEFRDSYERLGSIQQSSVVLDYPDSLDRPGTSALWLGLGEDRLHLSREQVAGLVVRLKTWLDIGKLQDDDIPGVLVEP